MEIKLQELLEIEQNLIPEFKRILLLLQNTQNKKIINNQISNVYNAIIKETEKLSLQNFTDYELQLLLTFLNNREGFNSLYLNKNESFSPSVRLSFQIEKELLKRTKNKSIHQKLSLKNRINYYLKFYHFRCAESYFKCARTLDLNVTFDFVERFYLLWYSTPGLEVPTDTTLTLPYWTTGKNINLKEYVKIEKGFVLQFFKAFLPVFAEIPKENMNKDWIVFFLSTYFRLYLQYGNKEELIKMFEDYNFSNSAIEILNYYLDILDKTTPRIQLVRKDK